MLMDRSELITALFRETDRAQRMKTPLSLVQIGIEQSFSASESGRALDEIADCITRLLRSYDLIGALGKDALLIILPGCDGSQAGLLAKRLEAEILRAPARAGEQTRPGVRFGIVSSGGRSPLVVIRDAELALQKARKNGPGSIELFTEATDVDPELRRFDSPPNPRQW